MNTTAKLLDYLFDAVEKTEDGLFHLRAAEAEATRCGDDSLAHKLSLSVTLLGLALDGAVGFRKALHDLNKKVTEEMSDE